VCVQELDVVDDDRVELKKSFGFEAEPEADDPNAASLDRQTKRFLKRQGRIFLAGNMLI
jgi:hypothetical protein